MMKDALGLKKGSVPFKNDLVTTLFHYVRMLHRYMRTYICMYVLEYRIIPVMPLMEAAVSCRNDQCKYNFHG